MSGTGASDPEERNRSQIVAKSGVASWGCDLEAADVSDPLCFMA
jgi:hypothetical protein